MVGFRRGQLIRLIRFTYERLCLCGRLLVLQVPCPHRLCPVNGLARQVVGTGGRLERHCNSPITRFKCEVSREIGFDDVIIASKSRREIARPYFRGFTRNRLFANKRIAENPSHGVGSPPLYEGALAVPMRLWTQGWL